MADAREVAETLAAGEVPLWIHPEWQDRFPWLVQGTTGRGAGEPFDLGVFGAVPSGESKDRWRRLARATGMSTAIHSRQVHGAEIAEWSEPLPAGMLHVEGFDAHLTSRPDLLLTVAVADCVPVFLVSETPRAIALAHAGWRGVAAGIVERVIARLVETENASPETLHLHCGPAICGCCYEVGPEVHASVRPGLAPPPGPTPIDLRAAIATRAVAAGLDPRKVTVSSHCTKCGPGGFFSHRAGSSGRQMGVLGRRV